MPQTFWALLKEAGNGTHPAYIRQGQVDATTWGWSAPAISLPVGCWSFQTATETTIMGGTVKRAPDDPTQLYISVFADAGAGYHVWAYRYDTVLNVFHQLMSMLPPAGEAPLPMDFAFATIGGVRNIWLMLIGPGYLGASGELASAGVYRCIGDAGFNYVGSGHSFNYNSGNINNPASPTGMAIDPGPPRKLWVSHTETRPDLFHAGHNISVSLDDGVTWDDQGTNPISNFALACLGYLEFLPGQFPDMWYAADFSGTGPYSLANATGRYFYDAASDDWISFAPLVGVSGQICMPFKSAPAAGVAWPSFLGDPFNTLDGGNNWTDVGHPLGFGNCFGYRAGRCQEDGSFAVGISAFRAGTASYIWWSDDYGQTFHQEVLSNTLEGVSLDFGPPEVPPVPVTYLEVMTYRDSRMFPGQSRFYVTGNTDAEAKYNAQGFAFLLAALSEAHWTGATGPYNTPPIAPDPGSNDLYHNIEMVLRMTWMTEDGIAIDVEVPCPASASLLSDQETIALLNVAINDAATGGLTYKVCTRGGKLAVAWMGASRWMRGFRSTETMRTLDPGETNTAE